MLRAYPDLAGIPADAESCLVAFGICKETARLHQSALEFTICFLADEMGSNLQPRWSAVVKAVFLEAARGHLASQHS